MTWWNWWRTLNFALSICPDTVVLYGYTNNFALGLEAYERPITENRRLSAIHVAEPSELQQLSPFLLEVTDKCIIV